jgi:uncharacterized protein (TIGR03790 family)
LATWLACSTALASDIGASAVLVYNRAMPDSKDVARHYAEKRGIPEDQILGLELDKGEAITRKAFTETLYRPLFQFLKDGDLFETEHEIMPATRERPGKVYENLKKSKIRYIVLCYGVPVKILEDETLEEPAEASMRVELRFNRAAVDHELSLLGRDPQRVILSGPIDNPLFGTRRSMDIRPENGLMMVGRVDGPSPEIAKGLVDKAMKAEKEGLFGRAYFDARGMKSGAYLQGDNWIRRAAALSTKAGFETTMDDNSEVFTPGFPFSHIALYAGWYTEGVSGPFTRKKVEFVPGAIAYHLHSYSASTLRTTHQHWVGPLLTKGATATMGCVFEPYLGASPDIEVFFERILLGFSFGEAAYASQRVLSWQTTVVGDPLYHPLSKPIELLQMELGQSSSSSLAWIRVLAVNQAIQGGADKATISKVLEGDTLSQTHAVTSEKLADLYRELNRPEDARNAYERTLLLNPSDNQRNRVLLTLAEMDLRSGKTASALDRMELLLQKDPAYPEKTNLLRSMLKIAENSGFSKRAASISERESSPGTN